MSLLLIAHAAATLDMVGAIWFVQLVHYPLLAALPASALPARAAETTRRTALLLGPVMGIELACALGLAWTPPAGIAPRAAWGGLLLLGAAWLSTGLIQFPIHKRLARGDGASEFGGLMRTNWLRVLLWTVRGGLALWMLAAAG